MKAVYGELKSLRSKEREALEKLAVKRCNPKELISTELSRQCARLCSELGRMLGLLIDREGKVVFVVVASKDRIYLPDLGRFRLDSARLRRLRLIVFEQESQQANRGVVSPSNAIAQDLLTDLEKLRLDALLVCQVTSTGFSGSVSLAYLGPLGERISRNIGARSLNERGIHLLQAAHLQQLNLDFEVLVEQIESSFGAQQRKGFAVAKDRAILVGAYTGSLRDAQYSMQELGELARTAGVEVIDCFVQRRKSLDPKTVLGKGKIEELVLHCLDLGAELLIFDRELSPGQLRSIVNLTELKVLDRSMLILDIFAQRAKSSEGRVQVELAQLKYSLPRLTEKDTGLSRLTGGIGGRGPGETKLEVSRRRARDRIAELELRIEKLAAQRALRRQRRQSRGVPVVALVGYTNAGKSTLLNSITKSESLADNKLFATLDPASKRMRFPNDKEIIFVDTVGFIRELPKELINAFRATLEEVGEADLLLHIVDSSSAELTDQIAVVEHTLTQLGFAETPRLLIFNKTDLLSEIEITSLQNRYEGIPLSALTRIGISTLIEAIQRELLHSFRGQDPGHFTEHNQLFFISHKSEK